MKLDIDVIDLLTRCGIDTIIDGGVEVAFSCPFPDHAFGDTRPSAYMNARDAVWICHGCKRRGNAVSFVAELENVSPMTASRWLREKYAPGFKEPEGSMEREWLDFATRSREPTVHATNEPLTPAQIASFSSIKWHEVEQAIWTGGDPTPELGYWITRGFSGDTLIKNELVWDARSQRVCLTVRNEHGQVIGYKGRTADPDVRPKYLVLGDRRGLRYGFAPYLVGRVVYGLHDAKPVDDALIVCEGELNAIAMRQHGFPNAVGLAGSELNDHQAGLVSSRASRAILLFDSDAAGHTGLHGRVGTDGTHAPGAIARLAKLMPTLVVPEHANDPAAMDRDSAHALIARATSALETLIPVSR